MDHLPSLLRLHPCNLFQLALEAGKMGCRYLDVEYELRNHMNIKFGIAGLGSISSRFASVLGNVDGVELSAVASRDQSRSETFAAKFGAKKAFDSYQEMITDESIDAVYIGLTHNFHLEIARLCLENHKAVLCEKPLVTSQNDAITLADLAKSNKTLLMEALWTRCQPAYLKAREWVNRNAIGEIKMITANYSHILPFDPQNRFYNPKLAGGSLFDLGVYPISFAIGILSTAPLEVKGLAVITDTGVDESAAFSLKFTHGVLASLSCGFSTNSLQETVIYGTKGHIVLNNCSGPRESTLFDGDNHIVEEFVSPQGDGFIYQIRHFAELYHQNKIESELIPLQDSIACAGVFDSLRGQWGLI